MMKKLFGMLLLLVALPSVVQAQYNYTANNGTITEYAGAGGANGKPSAYANGTWTTTFQGHTIRLVFSQGNGTDSSGHRIDSLSGNLWNGQSFSGGSYHLGSNSEGKTTIGIVVSDLASGLGTFRNATTLNLGWSDSTHGGYCGQLIFTKQ